tara:strand:+ start:1860 stop:2480 length:621 start_codon:yes stop_codon:yes gene_type:complete
MQALFCNIELILNWHSSFFSAVTVHLRSGDTFGDVFIEMIPLLRQLYIQYNENYDYALQTCEACKKSKLFSQWLEKTQVDKPHMPDLLSYLYLPIQRMITYTSLLKEIIEVTPPEHPDYASLCYSLEAVRVAASHGQDRADLRKNIDKVLQIQASLADGKCLAVPHRRFIHEGEVLLCVQGKRGDQEKERTMYLFNDLVRSILSSA